MSYKKWLIRKFAYIYYKIINRNLLKIYGNIRNIVFILKSRSRRKKDLIPISQYLFTYNTNLELKPSPNEIKDLFKNIGIKYKKGAHSIYVHRIDDINKINKQILYDYPENIGLKIIFS